MLEEKDESMERKGFDDIKIMDETGDPGSFTMAP